MGKLLRVDLSTGTLRDEFLPPEDVLRKYIGGVGLSAKILYEEVPVSARPLDPENRLIFMTGPLGGTVAPSSGQCCVCALSYETGYTIGVGHFHGRFGAMLKFSGYDGVVIQGASPRPVYLWINEGKAELRDASHLWGKDTHETYDLLREEVGEPEAAVACIGPAGENTMKGAAVCTDYHHMAAKGGTGAVMGSKKLKAIVCYGTQGVAVHDPEALLNISLEWRRDAWAPGSASGLVGLAGVTRVWYDLAGQQSWLAFKNLSDPEGGTQMGKGILELAKKSKIRPQGSFSCPLACAYRIEIGAGPRKGYVATPAGGGENIEGASGVMGVTEPGTQYWLTDLFDRMGWDSATPGLAMALAFELYERGLITKEQTDGLELKWGNADAVYELMQKMLRREGIGRVLAEGPKAVAEYFGGEAYKYAVHVKGTGYNIHDWRPLWGVILSYGVSCAGPCHQGIGPQLTAEPDIGYSEPIPPRQKEGQAEAVRRMQVRKLWDDSNGVCWFVALGVPNVTTHSTRALMAVTGWQDFTREEAWTVGERVINLCRLFSVRRGHTPAHDLDYGGRLLEAPPGGVAKGQTVAPYLKDMLREYYELMGWDPETGKPRQETLERLGLGEYYKDIADIEITVRVQDVVLPVE